MGNCWLICLKWAENGTQTGNDVDQLVGNGGLTTSVVFHGQRANHVRGVLGRIVHCIATAWARSIGHQCCQIRIRTERSVRKHGPRRGQHREHWPERTRTSPVWHRPRSHKPRNHLAIPMSNLNQVGEEMTLTALLQSILALDFEDSGFIRKGRHELVVDDDNRVILDTALGDQVCNTSCIGKCGDVTANLVERKTKVLGNGARELTLGLVTDDHDGGLGVDVDIVPTGKWGINIVREGATCGFGDGGVDTTAKTLVR